MKNRELGGASRWQGIPEKKKCNISAWNPKGVSTSLDSAAFLRLPVSSSFSVGSVFDSTHRVV